MRFSLLLLAVLLAACDSAPLDKAAPSTDLPPAERFVGPIDGGTLAVDFDRGLAVLHDSFRVWLPDTLQVVPLSKDSVDVNLTWEYGRAFTLRGRVQGDTLTGVLVGEVPDLQPVALVRD